MTFMTTCEANGMELDKFAWHPNSCDLVEAGVATKKKVEGAGTPRLSRAATKICHSLFFENS
jgi:hypothetical protein